MIELESVVVLGLGATALASLGGLGAVALRRRSRLELLLAAYVLAWSWLVLVTFALSPFELVSRAWLLTAIAVGVLVALAAWHLRGRPRPPPFRRRPRDVVRALRGSPALAVLAATVAVGTAYAVALAFFTPANDGDALAYHLARAAFWHQEHALGYVANAIDPRLNGNPPNAEIGQLATMVLAGSDRYVALPQLVAFLALALCAVALARRIGLTVREALFGALLFASLPVIALQASGALNDLVVASFLVIAVVFALAEGRSALVLVALSLGLALGTKLTAVLALPALVVAVALAAPRARLRPLTAAGIGGVVLGSGWYLVNLAETGEVDGGLSEQADQRAELSFASLTTSALRFALDLADMSGALWPYSAAYLLAAAFLAALALRRRDRSLLVGALLTAAPLVLLWAVPVAQDAIVRWWAGVGRPETPPFELGWDLNEVAEPALSWYGPLGTLLLPLGLVTALLLWRRGAPAALVGFALAPWLVLLTLVLTITWDPFRGRFLAAGVVLAAAGWGTLLRWRALASAATAIAAVTLGLTLLNHQSKASGIGSLLGIENPFHVTVEPIWTASRTEAETLVRPGSDDAPLFGFVEHAISPDATIAVAPRENDFLSPFFGDRLTRRVELVRLDGGVAPADAEWLVLAPGAHVRRCPGAWARALRTKTGWRVERRVGTDTCELPRVDGTGS